MLMLSPFSRCLRTSAAISFTAFFSVAFSFIVVSFLLPRPTKGVPSVRPGTRMGGGGRNLLSVRVFQKGAEQPIAQKPLQVRRLFLDRVVRLLRLVRLGVVPVVRAPVGEGLVDPRRVAGEAAEHLNRSRLRAFVGRPLREVDREAVAPAVVALLLLPGQHALP